MSVSEQIITVVQSGGIPFLAIMTFLAVISTMKAPGKETATDENSFSMTESSFWMMISAYFIVAAGLFWWLSITNTAQGQIASNYVMIIVCIIVCAFTTFIYFKRKLVVNGDEVTYYPIFGKAETFNVKTMSRLDVFQKDYYEELSAYNKSGKLLFKVQGYMTNSETLVKYMRTHRVRVVKKNMER